MQNNCDGTRQRGASRVELAVVVVVFGALATVFLERMLYYQEYAEVVAMEMTVANLRTGLRYRVAELLLEDKVSKIPTLAESNPMDWMDPAPENYIGELDTSPEDEPRGKWYFDHGRRELVYTANNRRFFSPSVYRDFSVRFRVMRIGERETGGAGISQEWVALVLVNDYSWLQ
ncbi:MAG: hypothetical protein WDZ63_02310 [Burkholderiales bacterium]